MNLKNLSEKQIIKNYKELCSILEIPERGGSSKKAQIENLEKYFSFKKDKNKFIIKKIYEEPKEETIKIKGSPFQKLNEDIICYLLNNSNEKNGYLTLTTNQLAEQLGYINTDFKCVYQLINKTPKESNIISEFYNKITNSYERILKTTIANLEKNGIIATEEIYYCIEFPKNIHRKATEDEIKEFLRIKKETLKKMKYKSTKEVYTNKKEKVYFKLIKEQLLKKINLINIYKTHKIYFIKNNIDKKTINYKNQIKEINKLFYNKIIENKKRELLKSSKIENKIEEISKYKKLCNIYIKLT